MEATDELNAALLQETILSIKREDVIRAAWQQVILVRMAGLEVRTAIWNEAVTRWAEEDLQFSSAMEARIQEVERLQDLNAAFGAVDGRPAQDIDCPFRRTGKSRTRGTGNQRANKLKMKLVSHHAHSATMTGDAHAEASPLGPDYL